MTVLLLRISAPEATDLWPRMEATAWSESHKPDCLKRMSTARSLLPIYLNSHHALVPWTHKTTVLLLRVSAPEATGLGPRMEATA